MYPNKPPSSPKWLILVAGITSRATLTETKLQLTKRASMERAIA